MIEILYLMNGKQELRDMIKYNMSLKDVVSERKKILKTAALITKLSYVALLALLIGLVISIICSTTKITVATGILAILTIVGRYAAMRFKSSMILEHYAEVYEKYGTNSKEE